MPRWSGVFGLCAVLGLVGCTQNYGGYKPQAEVGRGAVAGAQNLTSNTAAKPLIEIESGIYNGINRIRVNKGRTPLTRDSDLDRVARNYAQEMGRHGQISHTDSTGGKMEDRLEAAGIVDWSKAGENLASSTAGAEPVQSALWGWQRSAGHLENLLLTEFVYTGVGAYRDPETNEVFITQLFLTP